ncbi:MAG: tRNA-dihydrouridine synthase [Candidatus Saccharibacteria bacterium]
MLDLPKPFLVLAPMDDVTDSVFRQVVAAMAAPDLYFTEFVNVDGLQSPGREKLLPKLQHTAKEKPLIAQIWGKSPENYYKTTLELKEMGFAGVDINMGCPDKSVVKNGCCSALCNDREAAGEIIKAVKRAAGEDFPVSVKCRLGFDEIDLSWIEFLLSFKLNMLTIHGRTTREMSKVPCHWDVIGQIPALRDKLSPATSIVGNGDVMSRQQAEELAEQYNLDGIMIGRGIFEDPFIFALKSPWADYSRQQKLRLFKKHIDLFAKTWQHNERKVHTLNKFCKVYVNGFDGAKELREHFMAATSTEELSDFLVAVMAGTPAGHLK